MDDFDYAVLEFMRDMGFTATYLKQTDGEYDPATTTMTSTVEEIPVEAIMLDLTLQSNGQSAKFGTTIKAGDKNLLIRPPELPLEVNVESDRVRINGVDWKIVSMKELSPNASKVYLYDLYVRR